MCPSADADAEDAAPGVQDVTPGVENLSLGDDGLVNGTTAAEADGASGRASSDGATADGVNGISTNGLHIIIVGAGLGGLATAVSLALERSPHRITVLESHGRLSEIGAGLQITPNAGRLLLKWGLGPTLRPRCACPQTFNIHRYTGGPVIGYRDDYSGEMERKFGAPFWDLHRGDLQKAMYDRATELGVKVRFGAPVVGFDFKKATVTLESGEQVKGDLIVGADGLQSKTRSAFLGRPDPAIPTGDLAYRIVLEVTQLNDPQLQAFVSRPTMHLWLGPESHVIYYNLKGGTYCNLVLLVPDDLPHNVARAPGDLEEMRNLFDGWDPILKKFLSKVEKVDKWRLMHHEEMEAWTNPENTLVLMGDSCHPMLPYLAQGANSALEDGACLGKLLSTVHKREDFGALFRIYEDLRKPRSVFLHNGSFKQRHYNHLPDGPDQVERDRILAEQFDDPKPGFPFFWVDPEMQEKIFGYDVYAEVEKALNK